MLIDTSIGYSKGKPSGSLSNEEEKCLKGLHAEGYSMGRIAMLMSRSKNSIIGHCHRLGLERREPVIKGKVLNPLTNKMHEPKRTKPKDYRTNRQNGKFLLVELAAMGPDQCRFPFGEKTPYTFCGEVVKEGSPYCDAHMKLCYEPRRKK